MTTPWEIDPNEDDIWDIYLNAVTDKECTYDNIRTAVRRVAHERGWEVK